MKARRLLLAVALAAPAAMAQVATDGSVGLRATFQGPHFSIPWTVGALSGANLFHSLSVFNIRPGQSAAFDGLPGLRNIIARITDPNPSVIAGTVTSNTPGAALYLINPNGIVFGQGASVNVAGSFYASTAHYLQFADGARFESRLGPDVTLTVSMPAAFGFDAASIAPISARGATFRAGEGGTIGIVGGEISLGGRDALTLLRAPGGRVIVVGMSEPGTVEHGNSVPAVSATTALADVRLERNTLIDVSERSGGSTGGGAVFVRGADVTIEDASILARTRTGDGRAIDIGATGDLVIRHSEVSTVTVGAGNAGTIALDGTNVLLSAGSLVDTSCDPGCTTGAGGRLVVRAGNVFLVDGTHEGPTTFFVSNSFGGGRTGEIDVTARAIVVDGNAAIQGIALSTGDASTIHIRSDELMLRAGGQVDASSRGAGQGGDIFVANRGAIVIQGARADASQEGALLPSGIFANAEASGNAGRIDIATGSLDLSGGGEISSSAARGSQGAGGDIAVRATGTIRIAGVDGTGKPSGIATNTFSAGDAGRILLEAESIDVVDDGRVQSQSEGAGGAGTIEIRARDLRLASRGQVSSDARGSGDAGGIDVRLTGTLAIEGANSGIFAKTYATAQGGSIEVAAAEIRINGAGGVFVSTDGSGDAGSVDARADRLVVLGNGGRIASETSSSGRAGDVAVRSAGDIRMSGGAEVTTSSALGGGDAGRVTVSADNLVALDSGARIASESAGAGLAGDLLVRGGNGVQLRDGAQVTTSARFSDGGNIRVESERSVALTQAAITTAVGQGLGDGGNVTVDTPLLLMRDAIVSANAFGGDGGNIRIAAKDLFSNPATRVTASSELGIDGTVAFDSPAIDLSGALLSLSTGFLDLGAIAAGRCGARLAAASSSLVVRRFDPDEALRNGFLLARAPRTPARLACGGPAIARAAR